MNSSLLKRNIFIFCEKTKKIFFLSLLAIIIFMIFTKLGFNFNKNDLTTIFGMNLNMRGVKSFSLFIIINSYFILSTIQNVEYDILISPELLFLKLDIQQWINAKILYFFINSILFNLCLLVIYFVFSFFKFDYMVVLIQFSFIIMYRFFIQNILFMMFLISRSISIFMINIFLLLPMIFKKQFLSIIDVFRNNLAQSVIFIIFAVLIFKILFKIIGNNICFYTKRSGEYD